jgi:hypothetical protein
VPRISTEYKKCHNIYITSDEEIKDKCYVLSQISIGALYLDGVINTASMLAEGQWKKIILTTDQDLIKDGVQAIGDGFLEWFVKNTSCEYVPIIPPLFGHPHIIWIEGLNFIEEPKQEIKLEDVFNDEKRQGVKELIDTHKQETLEEASWKFNPLKKLDGEFLRHAFKEGAKWQQEQDKKCYHPLPYRLAKSDVNFECTLCGKFI